MYEWDHAHHDWTELASNALITDPCFRVPIPARALVDRVLADDTVARALLTTGNAVIRAALEGQRDAGRRDGVALVHAALRTMAKVSGIQLTTEDEARIDACDDLAVLDRWVANGGSATTAAELLR